MYCNGPNVSYGKKESNARIIALPERKIGPAGAILNHFRPNNIQSVLVTNAAITAKSNSHPHEYSKTPKTSTKLIIILI